MLLEKQIIEHIRLAQAGKISAVEFYKNPEKVSGKNEFLFFIKPEITIHNPAIKLDAIIALILEKLAQFKMNILNVRVLPATYLKQYNIIAQHYGVINKISSDVRKYIAESAKERFTSLFGKPFNSVEIFGSFEFLKEFPEFTPLTLDYIWQNKKFEKLAGGTYCQELTFNGRTVYLVNGFHPRQLDHFVAPGRSIITFTLVSDTDWKIARQQFIGATNPAVASPGSLRRLFFDRMDELGLPSISSSWNGVHLSAGPVEALVELIRYNSDFAGNQFKTIADYQFGQKLQAAFSPEIVNQIIENVTVEYSSSRISVFDLTEEKCSDKAFEILSSVF